MESYEKDREARCAHDDEVDYQTLDPKPGSSSRPLSSSRVFDALLPLSKDGFSAFHALLGERWTENVSPALSSALRPRSGTGRRRRLASLSDTGLRKQTGGGMSLHAKDVS